MLPREPEHREHAITRRAYAREAWKDTKGMPPEQRNQAYHQAIDKWDEENPNDPARRKVQQEQAPSGLVYKGTRWL